ncbi:unnamed protein product [Moneuplotes crassus]|uniref:Uncharacterized protein n=1 Tax=Euplotes crassus TaxID=5936 RepID=A0AAD1Y3B8_EUPCR|nr:unnamed protein product [Moneuplotes crassus]
MLQDQNKRFRCFQICRAVNVAVLVLVFAVCGFVNYGSESYFDVFMYHLMFAAPSILFNIVSYFRINYIFVSLASMFYLIVVFWTMATYIDMSATQDKSRKTKQSLFLFDYLLPGFIIAISFLAVASFYINTEKPTSNQPSIPNDLSPTIHPSLIPRSAIRRRQNSEF